MAAADPGSPRRLYRSGDGYSLHLEHEYYDTYFQHGMTQVHRDHDAANEARHMGFGKVEIDEIKQFRRERAAGSDETTAYSPSAPSLQLVRHQARRLKRTRALQMGGDPRRMAA